MGQRWTEGDGFRRAARWPILAIVVAALAIGVAFLLDQGSPTSRDYALVIGGPALVVLLPLAALWLLVVLVLQTRRVRSGDGQGDGPPSP